MRVSPAVRRGPARIARVGHASQPRERLACYGREVFLRVSLTTGKAIRVRWEPPLGELAGRNAPPGVGRSPRPPAGPEEWLRAVLERGLFVGDDGKAYPATVIESVERAQT